MAACVDTEDQNLTSFHAACVAPLLVLGISNLRIREENCSSSPLKLQNFFFSLGIKIVIPMKTCYNRLKSGNSEVWLCIGETALPN